MVTMTLVDNISSKLNPPIPANNNKQDSGEDRPITYKREELFGVPVSYILGGGVFLSLVFAAAIGFKVFFAPPPQQIPIPPPMPQIIQQPVIPIPRQHQQLRTRYPPVQSNVPLKNNGNSAPQPKQMPMSTNMENYLQRQKLEKIPVYNDTSEPNGHSQEQEQQQTGYGSNSLRMTPLSKIQVKTPSDIPQVLDPHERHAPKEEEYADEDEDDEEYEDEDDEEDDEQPHPQKQSRTTYAQQSEIIDLPPYQEENYYQ